MVLSYFAKTYCASLPKALRGLLGVHDPRRMQAFSHLILDHTDRQQDCPYLGSRDIADLLPQAADCDVATVGDYYKRQTGGTHSLLELSVLGYIVQGIKPRRIFEFGTFVGQTTRVLAMNSPADAEIITLDLPESMAGHTVGQRVKNTPQAGKVRLVSGDSMNFDFSRWYGTCDFVWVDANHDYPYVKSDTTQALRLIGPNGWIAWHDYRHSAWWSGVTRCLKDLKRDHQSLSHIRGTTICVLPPLETGNSGPRSVPSQDAGTASGSRLA